MIDVAHPDPVFARARRHEITLALRFLLGGGSADGIPFAFAALRPFRADTGSSYAPGSGRLGRAGPVDEGALHAREPLRLEPEVNRQLFRSGRTDAEEKARNAKDRALHIGSRHAF